MGRHHHDAAARLIGVDLEAHRLRVFVGRDAEQHAFERLLADTGRSAILAVTGIGGIGKSSLLTAFRSRAEAAGIPWTAVDGRAVPASPDAFETACRAALVPANARASGRRVLAVDAFERLAPLEGWLRDDFLPKLPEGTILVLAGRWSPGPRWRADAGVAQMLVECDLRDLAAPEARTYLERRRVPASRREEILRFAHGHPLALTLAADRVEHDGESTPLSPDAAPDLVHTLVQWLLDDVTDDARRRALEACSLVQYATQPVLATMLDTPDASECFEWLARQHFVEMHPEGLAMHDLVREGIAMDLRWRDPQRYRQMARRAGNHYVDEIDGAPPDRLQAAMRAALYTVRLEPYMRHHYQLDDPTHYVDNARPEDLPALAATVEAFEDAAAARRFIAWARQDPDRLVVVRDRQGTPAGLALTLTFTAADLETMRDADDPGIAALAAYVTEHAPLRGVATAMLTRFALANETFQEPGPVWSQLAAYGNGLYFTPGLAFYAIPTDTERDWQGTAEQADCPIIPETAFTSGKRRFMLLTHDMRSEPPVEWARNSIDRILGERPGGPASGTRPRILHRARFEEAALDVLHHFHDDDALRANPLTESCLAAPRPLDPGTLRHVFERTSAELLDEGPARSPYRVLATTYFDADRPKQIAAAEALSMSERTFRRHLRRAEQLLVERLWARETVHG